MFHELPGGGVRYGGVGQRDVLELRQTSQRVQAGVGDIGTWEIEFFEVR